MIASTCVDSDWSRATAAYFAGPSNDRVHMLAEACFGSAAPYLEVHG